MHKQISICFFGQLTDITQCNTLAIDNPGTVSLLQNLLVRQYPNLSHSKYTIAINNKMVIEDQPIPENAIIALMPPFSGG